MGDLIWVPPCMETQIYIPNHFNYFSGEIIHVPIVRSGRWPPPCKPCLKSWTAMPGWKQRAAVPGWGGNRRIPPGPGGGVKKSCTMKLQEPLKIARNWDLIGLSEDQRRPSQRSGWSGAIEGLWTSNNRVKTRFMRGAGVTSGCFLNPHEFCQSI